MNLLSLLTLFGGSAPYIDITPGDYPELHEEAACDKHRELVEAAQIEAYQARIRANGGTVRNVGAYYTPAELVDEIMEPAAGSGAFVVNPPFTTPQDHAARLKGRKAQ